MFRKTYSNNSRIYTRNFIHHDLHKNKLYIYTSYSFLYLVLDSHEMVIVTILDKLVAAHPEIKFGSYP